MKKAASTS